MSETRKWLKQELCEKYNQLLSFVTEKQLAQGKNIFTIYCVICHGNNGKTDGPRVVTV